jgi:hypothetical protein
MLIVILISCLLWFLASIPIALALLQGKEALPPENDSA